MNRKVILIFSVVFILFMAGLFFYYFTKHDTSRWQVAIGGIVVSSLPILLLFVRSNPFNIPIILGYYASIFCTTYLGSIANFYVTFKWWDTSIHFFKGILVAFIGIALYKLWVPEKLRKSISRWIIFLFVLSLAVCSSVFWEIYEFIGDLYVTHTMQRGGNKDTMYDLIFGFAGGLLIAIYAFIKKERV
ncbi:membrane-spanning protein [Peribacillus glennii]|uniref:Membrane-spanning protein n=1 Tax=Peribacillus glennii TaxID=2303991 RepID=A0A372LFH3_9BACI|nr:membrane-spanning protein [Peribacillus glennii]RFU64712.1 membrane-spanning protein [Peribacillus glennii]